jgi:hypothetical protein
LVRSYLPVLRRAVGYLPVGNGISKVLTGLYYLSRYGPLAFYSSEIVEAITLVIRLIKSVEGGAWFKLMGGDLAVKIYYLIAEERGKRLTQRTIAPRYSCSPETIRKLERACALAVHIAYESSAVDAQRLLRLQGYTLVLATDMIREDHYPFFLSCREKEAVLILPGTTGIRDITVDINAFELEVGNHKIHKGIHKAARQLVSLLEPSLTLLQKRSYSIRVLGHSLGAGIGAVLTYILSTEFGIKDIHCYGFGSPPCVSLACGDAMNEIVTNVVLRDDLVCRASTTNVVRLVNRLNSDEVSVRTRKYIENDLKNLRNNWAAFFFIKTRPVHAKIYFEREEEKVSSVRSWLGLLRDRVGKLRNKPEEMRRGKWDAANGLWIPGKIVHITTSNRVGQLQASVVDRTDLANIELHTHMLSDHRGDMYFKALVQLNYFGDKVPKVTTVSNPLSDEKCACCAGEFLWNSLLKGEPHVWLGKHVCKRCGMFVCDACSANSRGSPESGFLWPVRFCDRCFLASNSKL